MVTLFSVPRCGFGSLRMHSLHPPCAFFLPFSPLPAFSPWLPYVLQHTSFLARAYNIYKEYGHSSFPSPPLLFSALNCLYIMRFCIIHWFFRQKNSLIACRSGIKPYLCTRFRKGTPLNARRSGSLLEKKSRKNLAVWKIRLIFANGFPLLREPLKTEAFNEMFWMRRRKRSGAITACPSWWFQAADRMGPDRR